MILPVNTAAPEASLIAMLWGCPWSLLSKAIVNGASAGAVRFSTTNAVFCAVSMTSAVGRLGGGAAEPPPPPPAAPLGSGPPSVAGALELGSNPELSSRPPARIQARAANVAVGQRGEGPASRWPLRSAATAARYSRSASWSQPASVRTSATNPRISAQPPTMSPATSSVIDIAIRSGRNDGAGMWTPGGGVPPGVGNAPGGSGVRAVPPVVTRAVESDGRWSYSRRNSRPQ
jgi:hypothetical protein